jgi:hypothetical protein
VDKLLDRISSLENENRSLKSLQETTIKSEILYFISGDTKTPIAYLDEPK